MYMYIDAKLEIKIQLKKNKNMGAYNIMLYISHTKYHKGTLLNSVQISRMIAGYL